MAARKAIALIINPKSSSLASLQIQCHVKPGVDKRREGVTAVTEEAVQLCVSAQARDGESNKAVLKILSQALNIPKTSLEIVRGPKSRHKIIAIKYFATATYRDPEDWLSVVRHRLTEEATTNRKFHPSDYDNPTVND